MKYILCSRYYIGSLKSLELNVILQHWLFINWCWTNNLTWQSKPMLKLFYSLILIWTPDPFALYTCSSQTLVFLLIPLPPRPQTLHHQPVSTMNSNLPPPPPQSCCHHEPKPPPWSFSCHHHHLTSTFSWSSRITQSLINIDIIILLTHLHHYLHYSSSNHSLVHGINQESSSLVTPFSPSDTITFLPFDFNLAMIRYISSHFAYQEFWLW